MRVIDRVPASYCRHMKSHRSFIAAFALLAFCFPLFAQDEEPGDTDGFGTLVWKSTPGRPRLSSPVFDEENNRIFAGGSDGSIYAIDLDEALDEAGQIPIFALGHPGTNKRGEPIFVQIKGRGMCSTPLLGPDGTLYVAFADGTLAAITNAASFDNADVKWRYRAAGPLVGSPAMDTNGVVYIGSRDNRLHAVSASRGGKQWTFDANSDVTSSPLVTPDGNIVFLAGGAVFTVSPDGGQVAVFRTGTSIKSMPVAAEDGTLHFGANDGFIYKIEGDASGGTNGAGTNGVIWRLAAGSDVQSSPALGADGNLFIGTDSRRVLRLDDEGVVWRFPRDTRTRGAVRGDVAIGADGTVYVGTDAHTLYAITPAGELKWEFSEFNGRVRGSPVIDSLGTVYFTAGKSIYAVFDDVPAEVSPWPQFRGDAQHSARASNGAPFIITQPESFVATNHETVTFTVVASAGAPLSYQWSFNGEDIDPEDNSSATNATLVLEDVSLSDAGLYEVLVFNDFGEELSSPAELIIESEPLIVNDLTNRFATVGTTVRLQVDAIGDGVLTYQWHSNGVDIVGANASFYTITNAQMADSAAYDVTVANVFGGSQSRTSIVTIVELTITRATNNFIAAGNRFSAAVVSNQLFTWGTDVTGQLGDGGSTNRIVPTRTSTNTDWISVSAGGRGNANAFAHALGIRTDGSLYAWGVNNRGQLGIGSSTNDGRTPVRVGSDTNWAQAEAGQNHSAALRLNGTIWTWGDNDFGQLGIGGSNNMVFPTQVGFDNGWAEVRAGGNHTLARRADGTIWGWGRNEFGQLGMGNTNTVRSPAQIGTATNWVAISAGAVHSLGLQSDGTLWRWGRNFGSTTLLLPTNTAPVRVGSESNWVAIDAGYDHSLAINNQGRMFSFGANNIGQLGNSLSGPASGSTNSANLSTPTEIGLGQTWSAVDAGVKHSLARATDGTIWAWGWNNFGQVGDGTGGNGTDSANIKVPVQLTFTNFATVSTNNPNAGPPVFTQQPASTNVPPGGTAEFSAVVTGATPMAFQWYFNTNTVLGGQTNLTLVLPNAQAGAYHVVASNSFGWATSSVARLTSTNAVITPPGFPLSAATLEPSRANATRGVVSAPQLRPPHRGPNGVEVPLIGGGQREWVLEFKNQINDREWTPISTNLSVTALTNLIDSGAPDASRFYRVRQR
jgi:alpha-tubulin suppressor-like RCC1 family protein/outer membrane protein assembly factor BamB